MSWTIAPIGRGSDLLYSQAGMPSLDLRFAESKTLVDYISNRNLITFSRASGGTYVDSQGVIRNATTNLLLRSEEFDNAQWIKRGTCSVVANDAIAPDGTLTADKITFAGSTNDIYYSGLNVAAGLSTSPSIYIKKITATGTFKLNCANGSSSGEWTVDLSKLSTNWERLTASHPAVTVVTSFTGSGNSFSGLLIFTPSGLTVEAHFWGAQLEQSSTVGEYIPTTSSINSAPRFDHNPSTGESLGLLVEEARSNLLTYSQDLDNAAWIPLSAAVSGNAVSAPNGTVTADKLISNTGSQGQITHTVVMTASTVFTYSVFAKKAELDFLLLRFRGNDGVDSGAYFNLATGAIGTIDSGNTATIQAFGDGWYRCSVTRTSGSGATAPRQRLIATSADNTWSVGDGTSGIYVWGAQLEAGAFPTSYIPTTGTAATRSADVASISGSNYSSWANASGGVGYCEFRAPISASASAIFSFNDSTANNRVTQLINSFSFLAARNTAGAGTLFTPTTSNAPTVGFNKSAMTFANLDVAICGNSGGVATASDYNVPTLTQLQIGNQLSGGFLNGTIRRLTYWPQRLSNAVLQSITQ